MSIILDVLILRQISIWPLFGLAAIFIAAGFPAEVTAQQQVAYIDSEFVLSHMPEYEAVDDQLDQLANEWEDEIAELETELEALEEEYQARELLYTEREQAERQSEIQQLRQLIEQREEQYFGPEGELFEEQKRLLRPIQERILQAVETLAEQRDYDYVFDKGGDFLFLYASDQHDLSRDVLIELGIEIDND